MTADDLAQIYSVLNNLLNLKSDPQQSAYQYVTENHDAIWDARWSIKKALGQITVEVE